MIDGDIKEQDDLKINVGQSMASLENSLHNAPALSGDGDPTLDEPSVNLVLSTGAAGKPSGLIS